MNTLYLAFLVSLAAEPAKRTNKVSADGKMCRNKWHPEKGTCSWHKKQTSSHQIAFHRYDHGQPAQKQGE